MGVDGLWPIVAPAAETRSLTELTTSEGYEREFDGSRTYKIGVDVSLWLRQCTPVFRFQHHQAGENPELRVIFFRLARLFRVSTDVIIVYDGDKRAEVKRGKKVMKTPHWMTQAVRQMVEHFGFTNHQAPAEAEAELAHLNSHGIISAVLSNDIDTFLFGASCVIQIPNISTEREHVQLYRAADILRKVDLTRGGMILIALLVGGDYDKDGIKGCGIKAAYGAARYGLGDSLLDATREQSAEGLDCFLVDWRAELRRVLCDDPDRLIGHKCKVAADNIPDMFPDCKILQMYTDPTTSSSPEGADAATVLAIVPCQPDLSALASFCFCRFGWSPKVVHEKFEALIWEGAYLRMLSQTLPHDRASGLQPSSVLKPVTQMTLSGSGRHIKMYQMQVDGQALTELVQVGINNAGAAAPNGAHSTDSRESNATSTLNVRIPLPVLRRALPDLVKREDRALPSSASPPGSTDGSGDAIDSGKAPSTSGMQEIINLTGDSDVELIELTDDESEVEIVSENLYIDLT